MIRAPLTLALLALLAAPARAEESPMRPDKSPGFAELVFSANIAEIAKRDLGKTGPQMGLPAQVWCGDAVNRWRFKAGLTVVPSRRAVDQSRHGRRSHTPVPGALMISARRGGGHVDVVASVHGDGTITVVRPNWSRRVILQRIRPYGRFVIPG